MGRKKGGIPWNKGRTVDATVRFFDNVVEVAGGCWTWTGFLWQSGYACFWVGGKSVRAHRWAYERFRGAIPRGFQPDHVCKNPGCVNPWHLEVVTPRENVRRSSSPCGVNAAKTECIHGHPLSGENLYNKPNGNRGCRACRNAASERYEYRQHPVEEE